MHSYIKTNKNINKENNLPKNNLLYIAGYLDSINPFVFQLRKRQNGLLRLVITISITSSSNLYIISLLHFLYGGHLRKTKSGYTLSFKNEKSYLLAKDIINYSFIYKEIYSLIIRDYEEKHFVSAKMKQLRKNSYNEVFYTKLKGCYQECLNKKEYSQHLNDNDINYYLGGYIDSGFTISNSLCNKTSNWRAMIKFNSKYYIKLIILKKMLFDYSKINNNHIVIYNINHINIFIQKISHYTYYYNNKLNALSKIITYQKIKTLPSTEKLLKYNQIIKKMNNNEDINQYQFIFCKKCNNYYPQEYFRQRDYTKIYECSFCEKDKLINYYNSNKEIILEKKRKSKSCKASSPRSKENRIYGNLKLRVKKNNPNIKNFSKYLGCSKKEVCLYLESKFKNGMTWDNYAKEWQIDHIIPISFFDLSIENDIYKCCHYTNLQPLFIEENNKKSNKLNY